MRSEFFNFTASLLKKLKPADTKTLQNPSNPLQILHMMMYKYPPSLQRGRHSLRFRLLCNRLAVGSYVHNNKKVSVGAGPLFAYLCERLPEHWDLVESSHGQKLLIGDVAKAGVHGKCDIFPRRIALYPCTHFLVRLY